MIWLLGLITVVSAQQVLIPPYFDIAKGKNISATATCGEGYTPAAGVPGELFCTLVGAPGKFGIKGAFYFNYGISLREIELFRLITLV